LNSRQASLAWLALCSVAAYGLWNPKFLLLVSPSIAVNYFLAVAIKRQLKGDDKRKRLASWLLLFGVVLNLAFLGYFKYKNFFLEATNDIFGSGFALAGIVLPLGISFITFQKIAFLADVRAGKTQFDIYDYLAFVFFFPQLTSGPIVHYREVMPQFAQNKYRLENRDVIVGLCLLSIGLFKKVVLADGIEGYVTPVFVAADHRETIGFFGAWVAALGYSFEIYFDFSGYSDMAIGLARLFGIRLPINFNSPYKASSIIDFWSRWHMSLSRFLTTYVYMPVMLRVTSVRTRLGKPMMKNKKLAVDAFMSLVMAPTMLTMFLSGIWHGASFTFLLWGLLHGALLCVNQAWRAWRPKWNRARYDRVMGPLGFVLTFGVVAIAIVIFRSNSLAAAGRVLRGMLGVDGISLPSAITNQSGSFGGLLGNLDLAQHLSPGAGLAAAAISLIALFLLATSGPNSQELLRDFAPAFDYPPKKSESAASEAGVEHGWRKLLSVRFKLSAGWAVAMAALFILGCLGLNRAREFIYWQF
jgi:D-alanyl-lipoteichoic acid acyltransferase DltB (MBOAT superfamily)